MNFDLTPEQQAIFDEVEGSSENFLLCGKPGVGKSVLINALRNKGQKAWYVAAPTGIAALNIGGKTLHSLLGIRPSQGVYTENFNLFTDNQAVQAFIEHRLWNLIIDEVSMLRADMLDFIDRQLKFIKKNEKPFGGVQILFVGDFFQLPPICNAYDKKELRQLGYESEFAFSAKCFRNINVRFLHKVLRQTDSDFVSLLHSIREGSVSATQIKRLNKFVKPCDDVRIKLCATNAQVFAINKHELSKLDGEEVIHEASDLYGNWPEFPTDKTLRLKRGAQIIVKKNLPFTKLVNGTISLLQEIDSQRAVVDDYEIQRARWEQKEKVFEGNMWIEKFKASFVQLPVQLAWAISIHKSQGQTFEKAHISPQNVFAEGQLYVALSRLKTLEGLSLHSPIHSSHFKINKSVQNWYKKHGA
jgi:ATP-dependent DNA helicase PIF1